MSDKHHLQRIADALSAVDRVNSDTSVAKDVTRDSLKEIRDHIAILLDALDDE